MKKIINILVVFAAIAGLHACSEMNVSDEGRDFPAGSLSVVVSNGDMATKAITDPYDYEKSISKLDYFIFENNATLYRHETVTSPTFTGGSFSKTFEKLPESSYTLIVVANGPAGVESIKTLAGVEAAATTLADCSRTAGFVMYAKKTGVSVVGGQTTTVEGNDALQLERFAARVRLIKVTNAIPSTAAYADANSIQINGVFLSNVNSEWTLGAAAAPAVLANPNGRNRSTVIANASDLNPAACASVTGVFENTAVAVGASTAASFGMSVYGFPTGGATNIPAAAKLVICATVDGKLYYYPVLLDGMSGRNGIERNKAYDVSVTITGTGSSDPNIPVVRGTLTATVVVKDWSAGGTYDETI